MRLDKFLQTSRLVKRRAIAAKLCSAGRVRLNGQPAKPGRKVAVGDQLALSFGRGESILCEIARIPNRGIRKEEAETLCRILSKKTNGNPNQTTADNAKRR
ncbi:MAG: RNA-binding S4 domain-containing protein [Candidatus Poribacteria bacterium]|nr:RNA-binding S4 domain-containing protein [Candidatus Poribacteria bacterium]